MLYKKNERHLGTDIEIQIVTDSEEVEKTMEELFVYCHEFELEFSRFLPHSSLSLLNTHKILKVSERFLDIFQLALSYQEKTHGAFSRSYSIVEAKENILVFCIKFVGRISHRALEHLQAGDTLGFGGIFLVIFGSYFFVFGANNSNSSGNSNSSYGNTQDVSMSQQQYRQVQTRTRASYKNLPRIGRFLYIFLYFLRAFA